MLILTRRVGETVMIGDNVTVTVLGVKGNQVRVGVNAPRDVAVHREEIFERIKREEQDGGTAARSAVRPGNGNGHAAERHGRHVLSLEIAPRALRGGPGRLSFAALRFMERWPSGRRRAPAKGVRVKSPSRVRIPLSPPVQNRFTRP